MLVVAYLNTPTLAALNNLSPIIYPGWETRATVPGSSLASSISNKDSCKLGLNFSYNGKTF